MAYPTGYSGQSAIAMVRARTNELTTPTDATILTFLNAGVEQVINELGASVVFAPVTLTSGQNVVTLPSDVLDVMFVSFSSSDPTQAGIQSYPLQQLDIGQFTSIAGGQSGTGFGPPICWTILGTTPSGSIGQTTNAPGGALTIQVYPAPMAGQLNIKYRQRPTLWADTGNTSSTSLDTSAQEAVLLWACALVYQSRERFPQYDRMMAAFRDKIDHLKDTIRRRTVPKTSVVTDVRSYPGIRPGWWR